MTIRELRDALDAYLATAPEGSLDTKVYVTVASNPQPRPIKAVDFDYFLDEPILLISDID